MNRNTVILIFAGVIFFGGLAIYFIDTGSLSNNSVTLSTDERRGLQLLKVAQDVCLAGESQKAGLDLNVSVELKSQLGTLGAGVDIKKDKAKGAVNYLNEKIRLVADENIRKCLQDAMPKIQECLLGDCQASALPKAIEFQFTYQPTTQNPYLHQDRIAFGLEHRVNNRTLLLQPAQGYYVDSIELLPPGKTRHAAIYGVVKEGHRNDIDPSTRFCLTRASWSSPPSNNHTRIHCKQGEDCTHDSITPKWFDLCPIASSEHATAGFSIINTAYAGNSTHRWVIPSLKTLSTRDDLFGIGYTNFMVKSLSPIPRDAEGYFYEVTVNGWDTSVNGLPGSFQAKSHDFSKPLQIEFALQNLNFSGERNGCDNLTLTIHFVKGGKEVGEPVTLTRSYVALRDARLKHLSHNNISFKWDGKYRRAPKEYDTEVFVSSILISKTLEFAKHAQALTQAQHTISQMKTEFDQLKLVFEGHSLVAVIRPPLTQLSYELAIGILEDTQQIRFTYDNATARRLRTLLLDQRTGGPRYTRVIKADTFVYSIRGSKSYMASPPVCWDDQLVT
jgi:hypothetical protein